MNFLNYTITVFILLGAFIMLLSATDTKKIFNTLHDKSLKSNWRKLRILMFIFLLGYIAAAIMVLLGYTQLLVILSGLIFFMGALFVYLVVHTGLTSFRKLKQISQHLDDTQLKNEELEQFAYITSHDLKTPLRGISSLASFIKEDVNAGYTDQVNNHIDVLQGEVERLENLINGILHYSKIGKITPEEVDLKILIHKELKTYSKNTAVNVRIEKELPIIEGDKIQLSQVIANLISNAIKYNDKEVCQILITYTETKEDYIFTFEDNGPGIHPDYHEKIFEVFQTLQENNSYESTGIGLAIVKKIIEKHGGTITVISDGKLGLKFNIIYPKILFR